jgi:hypothetical protein
MPEQDFVSLSVPIEADDLSEVGTGPFRQRMTLSDLDPAVRNLLESLAVLGIAVDAATGRIRIGIESVSANLLFGKINTINGFGGAGTSPNPFNTDATYMPTEIQTHAWGATVRNLIT